MSDKTVGVIGGFGGYATLSFFERFLALFKGGSERDYPHIIFDCNFKMPSRTRALLTGDDYNEIVDEIAKSMEFLIHGEQKADIIILPCGTAHLFLTDVYRKIPEASEKVLDIIDITGNYISNKGLDDIFIVAAEGTLKHRGYEKRFKRQSINCKAPTTSDYPEVRYFIECVKQNVFSADVKDRFISFLEKYSAKTVLLGCTEFPVLVARISEMIRTEEDKRRWYKFEFIDPLELTLVMLKQML